ncbi:hypothetical protein D3C85_1137820 [compost metagenome]
MDLFAGGLDPDFHAELVRLLAQPDPGVVFAADPAEIVRAQAQQGAVVEHAAVLVAHRRVHHLPHCQAPHIAGQAVLQQGFGVGADDFEFAQGGQVHHRHPFAATQVFLDRAIAVITQSQPPVAVVDETAGQGAGA